MNQQTVTPAAVNAAAKKMAAAAKKMLPPTPLQKTLNKIAKKREQPNSSVLIIFYSPPTYMLPHEKEKEGLFFDTISGEVFEKLSAADAPTCVFPLKFCRLTRLLRKSMKMVAWTFSDTITGNPLSRNLLYGPLQKWLLSSFDRINVINLVLNSASRNLDGGIIVMMDLNGTSPMSSWEW